MYWDMEDAVHSNVEGRTVRMVLAGPLLRVVLGEMEKGRQSTYKLNVL